MLQGERSQQYGGENESDYLTDIISERQAALPTLLRDQRFIVSKPPVLTHSRVYIEK
jgi:hypothetical protein